MFKNCNAIRAIPTFNTSMIMTNKGLQITLPVMGSSLDTLSGILSCYFDDPEVSSSQPTHIALPLQISYRGDGTFNRRPRVGRMLVREKDAAKAKLQILTLIKRDATVESGQSVKFVLDDQDNLGVELQKSIFTVKTPIFPDIDTDYFTWKLPLDDIHFPTNSADYLAAFEFCCKHTSSEISKFYVLIESRRAQQLWSTHILFVNRDSDASLEGILSEKAGSFQNEGNSIAYDTELKKRAGIGLKVRVRTSIRGTGNITVTVNSTHKYLQTRSEDSDIRSPFRSIVNKLGL
jgi:hypothetical protein